MTTTRHGWTLWQGVKTRWRGCRGCAFLLEAVIATLMGVGMACFIQLVVGEEFATRGYARIYAPLAGWLYGDKQREQTTVLLIDDAALSGAGQSWPARYSYHARLAKALGRYRPKAVFFDIYFNQRRDDPSLPVLIDTLCALQREGVPVFLGAVPAADGSDRLRPELEVLAGHCFSKVGLQYTPDSLDRLAWNYPLREETEEGATPARQAEQALPSAALAIYERAYGKHVAADDGELALTWGTRASPYGVRWVQEKSAAPPGHDKPGAYCRPDMGWLEGFLPVGLKDRLPGHDAKPLCVFHDTLYASDLAAASQEEEAALQRLLQGRTVMIGTALVNPGDRVLSPLHGRIPGVYLHAMALDNLLSYGDAYPREVHFSWKLDAAHLRFYLFLLLSVSLGTLFHRRLRAYRKRKQEERRKAQENGQQGVQEGAQRHRHAWLRKLTRELMWKACKAITLVLTVCLAVYLGQRWFQIGLMTIVDILFFTLAAEWLELNEKALELFGHETPARPAHAEVPEDQPKPKEKA